MVVQRGIHSLLISSIGARIGLDPFQIRRRNNIKFFGANPTDDYLLAHRRPETNLIAVAEASVIGEDAAFSNPP
jgi:hypothetical protein